MAKFFGSFVDYRTLITAVVLIAFFFAPPFAARHCTTKTIKSCTARLALNLGLVTVGVSLMCIGNYWLFILGLAMLLLSLKFSLSPFSSSGARATGARNRLSWLVNGLAVSIVVVIFLWLTGWGKGLARHDAFLLWLVFAVPEVRYWLASQWTVLDTPVSQLLHGPHHRDRREQNSPQT